MSRDTWEGSASQPITYNRWTYANANPIIFTDPSGHCADFPNAPLRCTVEYNETVWGIAQAHGLHPFAVIHWNKIAYGDDWNENDIHSGDTIYLENPSQAPKFVPVPLYSGGRWNGYVEGSGVTTTLGFFVFESTGEEMVYDFETLQGAKVTYRGDKNVFGICGLSTNLGGLGKSFYTGFFHFPSRDVGDLFSTYSGKSMALSASIGGGIFDGTPLAAFGIGAALTSSFGLGNDGFSHDFFNSGATIAASGGIGKSIPTLRLPFGIDLIYLQYTVNPNDVTQYYSPDAMIKDIATGMGTEFGAAGAANSLFFASRLFFAGELAKMYKP